MANEAKETPTPTPSRKELKRQRKLDQRAEEIRLKNQENIRFLLNAGAIGLLGAAATGFGITRLFGSRQQPGTSLPSPRSLHNKEAVGQEPLPRETIQYYQTQLKRLNQEVLDNPQAFKELAPRIGQLAVTYFCSEMGYDPRTYEAKMFYEWGEEFNRVRNEKSGCIQTNTREDVVASTTFKAHEIIFNLTTALYLDPKDKKISNDPVISLFAATIHELFHASAPSKTMENKELEIKQRGVGILIPRSEQSSDNGLCYTNARRSIEEAVVEDAAQRMMRRIGFPTKLAIGSDYDIRVNRYRKGVIDRLFGGNHMPLLKLHQQTKQEECFTLIGEKLGYNGSERAVQEGEKYMLLLMDQGILS